METVHPAEAHNLIKLEETIQYLLLRYGEKIEGLLEGEVQQLINIMLGKFEEEVVDVPAYLRRTNPDLVMREFLQFIPKVIDASIEEVKNDREGITPLPKFLSLHHKPENPPRTLSPEQAKRLPHFVTLVGVGFAVIVMLVLIAEFGEHVLDGHDRGNAFRMLRHQHSLLADPGERFDESQYDGVSTEAMWKEVESNWRYLAIPAPGETIQFY